MTTVAESSGLINSKDFKKQVEAEELQTEAARIAADKAEEDADAVLIEKPPENDDPKPDADKESGGKDDKSDENQDNKPDSEDNTWLKSEDEDKSGKDDKKPQSEKTFTVDDLVGVKTKYKARARVAETKAEQLERENAELKKQLENGGKPDKPAPTDLKKPTRGDYDDEDEYLEHLSRYQAQVILAEERSKLAADDLTRERQRKQADIEKATDEHYVRAATLAQKSGITPEAYQAADLAVRRAIDVIFPETGDAVADVLIARLGPGSEKVFFHLGRNSKKLAHFQKLLNDERSGTSASIYLGELKAELKAPVKKTSNAPEPAEQIRGDKGSSQLRANQLKREYKDAQSKPNGEQAAYNIRKRAKAAGVDVSNW